MGKQYKYYTNGINEKKVPINELPPEGWKPGRLKSPVTTKNCMWINNGKVARFIEKGTHIPDGYVPGRLNSHLNPEKESETKKKLNKHWYNNGEIELCINNNDIPPKGFVKGRLPMTDSQKEKLSEAHTGMHHTEEAKRKISEHSNNNREKANKTIIEKYGSLENYYNEWVRKQTETRRKNKTLNTSKIEKQMYKDLCEEYGKHNVKQSHKTKEYPFYCDFYIVPTNQYIELNAHWTHGPAPFDSNNPEHIALLETWQEKAKTSQYYQNAIKTWTERDVIKQKTAKENNLNYTVLY